MLSMDWPCEVRRCFAQQQQVSATLLGWQLWRFCSRIRSVLARSSLLLGPCNGVLCVRYSAVTAMA